MRVPWLLCIFCLLLTVVPPDVTSGTFPNNLATPARLLAGLFCFLWIIGFIASKQGYLAEFRVNTGAALLGVFLSLELIIWGEGLLRPGSSAQELSRATAISGGVIGVGIALYAIAQLGTARKRSIVLACLLTGLTYSAVLGILQHTMRMNLEDMLVPPGFESSGISYQGEAVRRGSVRAFGTFLNALPFGAACAMSVPLAMHFARYSSRRSGRVLATVAALILLIAVPTSISRSSLIVLVVAISFYAISLTLRRIAAVLIGVVGAFLLIALTSFNTLQSLSETITESADDPSVLVRYIQTDTMLAVFEQHPIFGLGLGAITVADFGPIDNWTVIVLAEGGILGGAAYAALSLGGVFGIIGSVRCSATKKDRDQAFAVGAMFLGYLAAAPTFAVLGYEPGYSIFFLIFGILWSGCSYSGRTTSPQPLVPR